MQPARRPQQQLPKPIAPKRIARPPAVRPQQPAVRPQPPAVRPQERALIPERVDVEFDRIDGTAMFDTIGRVRALPAEEASRAIVCRSIAEAYSTGDLFAIAEIGRHYLESGGYRLAVLIFEGLEAIDPDQHYFVMALGLAKDRLGDKAAAMACYRRAQQLDAKDARADLNVAELLIEAGKRREAVALIEKAEKKAEVAGEEALVKKAAALLSLMGART